MSLINRCQKSLVVPFQVLLILLIGIFPGDAFSGSVNLAWNANPEPDIAGYRVFYGTESSSLAGNYQDTVTPAVTLNGLTPGATYYAAVLAINSYRLESPLSEQISFTIPIDTQPEISVEQGSGVVLASGQGSVDLGVVNLGAAGVTRNFLIRNDGTGTLSGLAVTSDSSDFTVEYSGGASLEAGESAAFAVAFNPSAAGIRSAILRIACNDADENPFEITLSGTGTALPDIAVSQLGVPISGPIHLGSPLLGASSTAVTFVISNPGNAPLEGLAISNSGAHPGEFRVENLTSTTVQPGGSASFQVTFTPAAAGSRAATLNIASNDPDENPFSIQLAGEGLAFPEIAVLRADASEIADGAATVSFSEVMLGSVPAITTLTIRNLGTAALTGLGVSAVGSHAADFTVSALASPTLAPGTSMDVQISFNPSAAGPRVASLQITSNDGDESPFDIALTGSGATVPTFPVLAVENSEGQALAPEAPATPFGELVVGVGRVAKAFTIRNTGNARMTGLNLALVGADATSFALTIPASTVIEPGTSMTFTANFSPDTGGRKTAAVRITTTNPSLSAFEIGLDGTGLTAPEIAVIVDDDADLAANNASVQFGRRDVGAGSAARTITLRNLGSAELSGLSLAGFGAYGSDFTTSRLPIKSLAPGMSTSFKVFFRPKAPGTRSGGIVISSNDADEGQFRIALGGNGIAVPEIEVKVDGGKPMKDNFSYIDLGTQGTTSRGSSRLLTIRNTGTARLEGLAIKKSGLHGGDFSTGKLKVGSLAPGASAQFKVHFKPTKTGTRWGAIAIASNDTDEKSFDIILTGVGKSGSESSSKPKPTKAKAKPTQSLAVVDGKKFLALTIKKKSRNSPRPPDVEVSSNLVDWSSGSRHTTTLMNDERTLKVRDNTPHTQQAKRYIRLKPVAGED